MKLGKKPARTGAVTFKLTDFVDMAVLPKPPASFGHEGAINQWGALGNHDYGDCVWAGAAHETMLWCAEANHTVNFSDQSVLSDYSAVTGFNPADPNSDRGTDMEEAAKYRRTTGVVDAHGVRHKVAAYLGITPGNSAQLSMALYMFGAVGIGVRLPASAVAQTNQGKIWSCPWWSRILGGHYIPMVAKRSDHFVCVTWGRLQTMTQGFYSRYCDEAVAYVSEEMLTAGRSPEGFNKDKLLAALGALGH